MRPKRPGGTGHTKFRRGGTVWTRVDVRLVVIENADRDVQRSARRTVPGGMQAS
jgi:hypothetical protein